MILLIFALFAPIAMAFYGIKLLIDAIDDKSLWLPSKVALLFLVTSFLCNIYLLTSLYF